MTTRAPPAGQLELFLRKGEAEDDGSFEAFMHITRQQALEGVRSSPHRQHNPPKPRARQKRAPRPSSTKPATTT